MNRNVQIVVGILILVVLGAGAFVLFKNSSKTPSVNQTSNTTVGNNESQSQKTLKDLITSGKAQKCDFTNKDQSQTQIKGTSYIANGKMRGDFNTTAGGKEITMHMIIADSKSYSWVEGQNTGFMMAYDINNMAKPTGTSQSVDLNKYIDYTCTGWTVDNSMLTPPANVKFTDTTSMMKPSGSAGSSNQCASCNYLTGDQKTQCLSAMHCQ